jgi:dTMP kinase
MKFIVIEGLDGSGKSTQIKLLREYLENERIAYNYLHFPRTDTPVYGELIARFLRGEMGDISTVDPYLIALIYAGDRNDAKEMIKKWISEKSFVLVDRYVISNIAFQCAKLKKIEDQLKLKEWIMHLEYEHFRLPSPDMNIFLDVPFSFTSSQLSAERHGNDRDYLLGGKDIHEDDLDFQYKVREIYLSLKETDKHFNTINCADPGGEILSPEKIFIKLRKLIFES